MARYGYNYSSSTECINALSIQIEKALGEAFEKTCEDLQSEIDNLWEMWVSEWSGYDGVYERTGELQSQCPVKVTNINFDGTSRVVANIDFSDEQIHTVNNPQHHAMMEDGTIVDIIYLVSDFHDIDVFVDQVTSFLSGESWKSMYRKNCKEMGLSLK